RRDLCQQRQVLYRIGIDLLFDVAHAGPDARYQRFDRIAQQLGIETPAFGRPDSTHPAPRLVPLPVRGLHVRKRGALLESQLVALVEFLKAGEISEYAF